MSLQEQFEKLQGDLGNLDMENIGGWPLPIKAFCCLLVMAAVIVLSYQAVLSGEKTRLNSEAQKEVALRTEFEKKVQDAANLEAYRGQMVEMTETFSTLLAQLPKDTEVPGLVDDISNKGQESGLNFDATDLQQERNAEFYVELPINYKVRGGYHDFGSFVSGVAGLPRIVTLHDFVIESAAKSKGPVSKGDKAAEGGESSRSSEELTMTITVKTYRYKSADESGKSVAGKGKPMPSAKKEAK